MLQQEADSLHIPPSLLFSYPIRWYISSLLATALLNNWITNQQEQIVWTV
jgi:hypothetical protein